MWLLVVLLVGVPGVARMLAHLWFVHRRHVLDHAIPDDLPETAGEWLRRRIAAARLPIDIVVTNHITASRDAFHVLRNVIQLTEETSYKRDPMYWAIAAHELGHARWRLAHPGTVRLTIAINLVKSLLVRFGLGLAIGNVLYAIPLATRLAHGMLAAALMLHAVELAEEVIASANAMHTLREEPVLTAVHLRAAKSALRSAFLTYLLPWCAYLALYSQWWIVKALTATPRAHSGGLTALGLAIAAIASAYVLVVGIAQTVRPQQLSLRMLLLAMSWMVAAGIVIALGWDRHATATYAWLVLVAFSTVQAAIVALLELPTDILLSPLMKRVRRYSPGIEMSPAFESARRAGNAVTKAGNQWLKDIARETGEGGVARRILALQRFAIVPLLVAFWCY